MQDTKAGEYVPLHPYPLPHMGHRRLVQMDFHAELVFPSVMGDRDPDCRQVLRLCGDLCWHSHAGLLLGWLPPTVDEKFLVRLDNLQLVPHGTEEAVD